MSKLSSPLRTKRPDSVSVCGELLRKGQSTTVDESAVGPSERRKEANGLIKIRRARERGKLKVTCVK